MLNPEGWVTRAIGAICREAHWIGRRFFRVPWHFAGAKRCLLAFAEELRRSPKQCLTFMFATVWAVIAAMKKLPHRPGRIEPRAKNDEPRFLSSPFR